MFQDLQVLLLSGPLKNCRILWAGGPVDHCSQKFVSNPAHLYGEYINELITFMWYVFVC